jgi:hypothetical protein
MMKTVVAFALVVAAACGPQAGKQGGGDDDDMMGMPDAATTPMPDSGSTVNGTPPGGACSCDADCQDAGSHEGVCIYGICMTKASGACASGGSTAECDAGSQCWYLSGNSQPLCWPECAKYQCGGMCASDGTCEPTASTDCDPTCGLACSCNETSCATGNRCVNGECVPDVGAGPGPGPGPACSTLPTRDCTTGCSTLTTFSPRTTPHYDDYPINGETSTNQYRSYLRQDLKMLVDYATAKTYCKTAMWTTGNGGALGLGDMSEANGAIPGTSIGSPGHPAGTHTNGYDIDLGYYQIGTADNKLRPICPHLNGTTEANHCTADPDHLDVWRHALFLGHVFESTRTRVIGVDGKAGPQLVSALNTLCMNNWLSTAACNNIVLAYETTNNNQGWYYFHHHHSHISLKQMTFTDSVLGCESSVGCDPNVRSIPQRPAGIHRVVPHKN